MIQSVHMHEASPQRLFDFSRVFSFHTEVYPEFLEPFLREVEDFAFTVEAVIPNPYIQVGESPTGIRDLQFAQRVKMTHIPTGEVQLLTKTYGDEPFTVVK